MELLMYFGKQHVIVGVRKTRRSPGSHANTARKKLRVFVMFCYCLFW